MGHGDHRPCLVRAHRAKLQNGKIEIELGRDQDDPLIFGGRNNRHKYVTEIEMQIGVAIDLDNRWIHSVTDLDFDC